MLTRERSDGLRAMSLMKDEDPAPTDPNLSGFPSRRVDDQAKNELDCGPPPAMQRRRPYRVLTYCDPVVVERKRALKVERALVSFEAPKVMILSPAVRVCSDVGSGKQNLLRMAGRSHVAVFVAVENMNSTGTAANGIDQRVRRKDAAELLEIAYEPLPAVVGAADAMKAGSPAPMGQCAGWCLEKES